MWVIHLFFGSTNWILTSLVMIGILILHTVRFFEMGDYKKYSEVITINDVAIFTVIRIVTLGLTYVKEK